MKKVNRMGYVIALVAAMFCFYSCSDKIIDTQQHDSRKAISFSNIATKADFSNLKADGFGVWAFITNNATTNFPLMENTKVVYNSTRNEWEYSPLRYWVEDTDFSFVAVYPYDESNSIYTVDSTNGSVKLTLTETPSEQDYLVATEVTNPSNEGFSETIDLQFKHLLSSVGLKIWRDGGKHQNDQMRIKEVTLSNIRKSGSYSSKTDAWTFTGDKLSTKKTYTSFSDGDNIGAANVAEDGRLTTGGIPAQPFNDMMLIPQTLDASNMVSLKILYEIKRNNAVNWESAELEAVLPSVTWEPSTRYTYNIVLSSVTDITIYYIQTKVDPWGTPQVGGTVIIK